MARPEKHGLYYASIDVDIFDDPKLMFVCERFEEKGELIAVKLLLWVYKNGYYAEWNDEIAVLFSSRKFKNVSFDLVKEVVGELIKRKFFDEQMFSQYGILTSKGIQKRWLEIVTKAKRKTTIDPKFDLLTELIPSKKEETSVNKEETPKNSEETPVKQEETTQSKVKKSKVKETIQEGGGENDLPPQKGLLTELDHPLMIQVRAEYPKLLKMKEPLTNEQCRRLVNDYTASEIDVVFARMQNFAKLLTNNDSANLTARHFLRENRQRKMAFNPAFRGVPRNPQGFGTNGHVQ